ncbi:MAG: efflux RND transporter periplasmic adaptor subunit [Gammaproteobacteria bacterium]|nr:efflux RND transporter periplasmic adaptor subunit [Gammaproteobacteria bacterium]
MNKVFRYAAASAALLIAGVLIGITLQRHVDTSATTPAHAEKKILLYRHPMNPAVTSAKPLKDEMGMDYIPVYADDAAPPPMGEAGAVSIAPQMIQNMGVRTARVERGALKRIIDSVGYVSVDENKIRRVQVRTEGWVESLHVNFVGQQVRKGDLLFELYAPRLVNAQQEYLAMLAMDNAPLQQAARQRLAALGVGEAQIAALEKTRRVPRLTGVYAQEDGVVQALAVRPGAYVEPATETVVLADLSSVWVLADVFGSDAAQVQPGAEAAANFAAIPGKTWQGSVDYIYPGIDSATRTLKVRLRFDNPAALLKPNMYASVRIGTGAPRAVLSIPREALIQTGDGARVIVALGEGKFAPRAVRAGMESGERVEIVAGLREGEQVVTSGQFLIDSETSLKAGLQRLSAPDGAVKNQEAP